MSLQIQTSVAPVAAFDAAGIAARRAIRLDPALRPAFLAHGESVPNLERLFADDALCVTTGQQPGLLTGPLYTVYKALSAVALANALESRLQRPVIPVFWVAGDDHDFAEANHVHVVSGSTVHRLALREREADAALTPLYREAVGATLNGVLNALQEHTPDSEFRPAVFDWIRRHYHPETDLATAFAGALAELLHRHGIVVFRPTHPSAKQCMAPWLLSALERAQTLDARLAARVRDLAARDLPTPVPAGDGASLVMLEGAQGRDRLMLHGERFETRRSSERWDLAQLRDVARRDPQRLSPNVLLRPVIEAALLPTLAYVAGPGELAYFSECDPLYAELGVVPQERVGRWSGWVLESHVEKVLRKYAISEHELRGPEGQLEAHLVRDAIPESATRALHTLRQVVRDEYAALAEASATVDPTLKKHVLSSSRSTLRDLADIEKRIIAHLKKQNDILAQQLAKARANIFPLGKPQERVFNVVPFLARYGPVFLDQVFHACKAWTSPLESTPSNE